MTKNKEKVYKKKQYIRFKSLSHFQEMNEATYVTTV